MKTRKIQIHSIAVFFLSFLFLEGTSHGQQIFRGSVIDASRNEPVPYATIFLTNTTFGVSADEDGKFTMKVPVGNYDVVVRMLGFESLNFALNTSELQPQGYRIMLTPLEDELDEIEVEDERDPAWYRNLDIFKFYFLGSSQNARKSELKNEKVLRLDDQSEKNVLNAKAVDVLRIDNPNLGYNIQFLLTNFRFEKRSRYIFYGGNPLFILDTTLSKAKLRRVESNREEAYRGSLQHFIRALYRGQTVEEGFEIRRLDRLPKGNGFLDQLGSQVLDPETLITRGKDGKVTISYDFHLHILYKLEKESTEYEGIMNGKRSVNQSSLMKLEVASMELYDNGSYPDPFGIMVEGYMAWERVADLLPLDYKEKTD